MKLPPTCRALALLLLSSSVCAFVPRLLGLRIVVTNTYAGSRSRRASNDDDDVFADLFAARDAGRAARRASIQERAAAISVAIDLEEELMELDDDEGRLLDPMDEDAEENYEDEEDEELEENIIDDDENYCDNNDEETTTRELFDKLFALADADESGGIDCEEFSQLYQLLQVVAGGAYGDAESEARMKKIFESMDEDGSGTVEVAELKEYITETAALEWPELHDEVKTWE